MKNRILNLAMQQATQSIMPNRLGAVLVRKKHIIGAGYNRPDHPILHKRAPLTVRRLHAKMGLHAEVAALHSLDYVETKDAVLYVIRLRKDDSLALSKPCSSCHQFISDMGIKRVVYSDDNGFFHTMKV